MATTDTKDPATLNATDLAKYIEDRDAAHKLEQKHLKALLRVRQDMEASKK